MATAAPVRHRRFRQVLSELGRPRVALMLALGVSSGLPFALIGNTLGFWLKDDGVGNAAIGFASWVGLTYTIKFLWGAMADRIKLPLVARLGRRRSWMLVSQVVAGAGLVSMGLVDPRAHLDWLIGCAGVAALGAAVQDTAMDAWRIESAADADELGLLTAAYSLGYRIALIFTESVILMSAKRIGWPASYVIYGLAMAIGVFAVFKAREPDAADAVMDARDAAGGADAGPASFLRSGYRLVRNHGLAVVALAMWIIAFTWIGDWLGWRDLTVLAAPALAGAAVGFASRRLSGQATLLAGAFLMGAAWAGFHQLGWMPDDAAPRAFLSFALGFAGIALVLHLAKIDAIGGPFTAFFSAHGIATAALMLLMITCYHLCDYMRGPMTNPYYSALHLDKDTIGIVRIVVGTPGGFLGIALGGLSSLRLGNHPTLVIGAIAQPIAIAAFALLGFHGGDYALLSAGGLQITAFQTVMTFDAIAIGYSGVALVAYMSTLTSLGYTATQYALLTSALAMTGKVLKGFSGTIVDALAHGRSQLEAFALFYLIAAALGIPAILLCLLLARITRPPVPEASAPAPTG